MRYLIILSSFLMSATTYAQNGVLTGTISASGNPLAYASVSLRGTSYGCTTDQYGIFKLAGIKPGEYVMVCSSIGYFAKHIRVKISGDTVIQNAELQEGSSKLSEVIVTGVSRATELRSNPVPIAVITRKEIQQSINTNIIDAITKGVPGVTAVTTGPNISKPFIRGLGYNRVLTLYDGIRQEGQQWGDEHGIEVDQYAMARAEVIKGPASLTYGSDALAGVINLIPYIPAGENGKLNGDWTTEYHTNNGLIASSLGLAYKKNDWKYAFWATGKTAHNYYNKVDGYVYNTAYQEYIFSGMARVDKPWGYSQFSAAAYNNKQEIPDGSRDSLTRRFTIQVAEGANDDIKNRPFAPVKWLTSYGITPLHQHIQHYRIYNKTEIKAGSGIFSTSLGWQQSVRREYNHPTQPEQPGLYVTLNTINYDFRYSPQVWHGWETSFGLNGIYQNNASKDATDFPIPDYGLFDIGAFAFAKKTFGKVDISGGIRYDTRHINWNDFYVGSNPTNGFEQKVSASDPAGKLQFPAFSHNYYGISGSLGFTYNISEHVLLKANIARGYRAPNITEIGSNGLDPGAHIVYLGNRNFKPEFSLQQDLGFIAYLKNADLALEVFNNNIENYIYQSRLNDENGNPVIIVPGNTTYQYQQSKARLYGAEFTFNLHPQATKWVEFDNSLAYVIGLNKNQKLIEQSNGAAKYLPFIPPLHWQSDLKFKWNASLGWFSKFWLRTGLDFFAAQNRFYALNDTETPTTGYTLAHAGVGSTIKRKSGKPICELFIQADNLFDVAYQSNLNRLKYFEYYTASPNGRSGIYNMGRNVSFKVVFTL
ncbi:TonB-dependent receptor [Mucilaginibacter achroorhodeus]|uniref:TonB-dependent receptor n=1 Tax=Mucilaginibacter achroorhodeus TaxID=2599294 RepID=A0A563UBJ4_9SPHI|nr:TonB-dependent receptor [Mucilaginibacter achroorhodeus]